MIVLVIAAVAVVLFLIYLVISRNSVSEKVTTVPGLSPLTKEDGNLADIGRAGSLHEFLLGLHKEFGDIASFWMGPQLVYSIASSALFKQHQHVTERPPELFKLFEPFIGESCIQYANGQDWRDRRNAFDKSFSHDEMTMYYPMLQKLADSALTRWSSMATGQHVPLTEHMSGYAIRAALVTMMGDFFDDDEEVIAFKKNYDLCWAELERRLVDPVTDEDSPRAKAFNTAKTALLVKVRSAIEHRRKYGNLSQELLLVDRILEHFADDRNTGEQDCFVYIVAGFHTTGNVLSWAFYYMATHPDVQEKMYREVLTVLGNDDIVDSRNIRDLVYVRQVLDETLRCAVVAPWAARFEHHDSELVGHKVEKETPVFHALGASLKNEKVWPSPDKFDPDRFSAENSKGRPTLAFAPFGIGKRICPGYKFAYVEAIILVATLVRKFKVDMVEGQEVKPAYGFVTHPAEEIWVTVSKRVQ